MQLIVVFLALALFFFLVIPFFLLLMIVNPVPALSHFAAVKKPDSTILAKDDKTEQFSVRSFDGYELHCVLVYCTEPKAGTGKFVVISHGFLGNHLRSARFARIYLNLNYNVVLYDLRSHGKNEKDYITLGLRESRDLNCVINELHSRFGRGILVGLHGESMGAATSLLSLPFWEQGTLAFCVSDCAFSDLASLFEYMLRKRIHLPLFFLPLTDRLCRIFYHYSFFEVCPVDAVVRTKIPLLFIHGSDDTLIPPHMCLELFESASGYKEMELVNNAIHASSIEADPERYERVVRRFLANATRQIAVNPAPEKTVVAA